MKPPRKLIRIVATTLVVVGFGYPIGRQMVRWASHDAVPLRLVAPLPDIPPAGASALACRGDSGGDQHLGNAEKIDSAIALVAYFQSDSEPRSGSESEQESPAEFRFSNLPALPPHHDPGVSRVAIMPFPVDCDLVSHDYHVIQLLPPLEGRASHVMKNRQPPAALETRIGRQARPDGGDFEFSQLPVPQTVSTRLPVARFIVSKRDGRTPANPASGKSVEPNNQFAAGASAEKRSRQRPNPVTRQATDDGMLDRSAAKIRLIE